MKAKFISPQLIILICSYMMLSACVSSKKYKDAVAVGDQMKIQNQQLTENNKNLESMMADQKSKHAAYQGECEAKQKDCDKSQAELKRIHDLVDEQEAVLVQLKAKISMALADFMDKGVNAEYRDGLVYVRLSDDLLFKSSSSTLGENGKKALGSLARVLNDYPRLKVIVVGHTDSTKFVGGDNWTLSTERANGIVKLLRDSYKIDPTRLTAAGRGKYDPIASNATAEGRAKNRRTDIILKADLERLWEETKAENNK
jgi:chemotaxis protein MotB